MSFGKTWWQSALVTLPNAISPAGENSGMSYVMPRFEEDEMIGVRFTKDD